MRSDFRDPPGRWAGATSAGDHVYFRADLGADDVLGTLVVWHWCPAENRWRASNPREHTLVSAQPLHLEPSLLWDCCDRHGFLRDGRWAEA